MMFISQIEKDRFDLTTNSEVQYTEFFVRFAITSSSRSVLCNLNLSGNLWDYCWCLRSQKNDFVVGVMTSIFEKKSSARKHTMQTHPCLFWCRVFSKSIIQSSVTSSLYSHLEFLVTLNYRSVNLLVCEYWREKRISLKGSTCCCLM